MLLLTLLAARAARADDWSSLGLDGPRSRLSAERSGASFGPAKWEHALPPVKDAVYRTLLASPAAADGVLVYGTYDNFVRGLRAEDGQPLWELRTKDAVYASPAIWRGWAYVAGLDRLLYAVRIADGQVVWKRELGGAAYASPAIVDGSVFVATGDPTARVYRIDAETGAVVWQAGGGVFQQAAYASIAVAEGHVLVGEVRGRLHSFAAADGKLEWTAETGGLVNMSSPVVINGRVYLLPGGDDGQLHAFELSTGQVVKGWPVSMPVTARPADANTLLGRGFVVSSLAGVPGAIVFDRRVEDRLDTDGDGATDRIVLDEAVVAMDPEDGHVLWARPNGHRVTDDPNQVPTYGFLPTPALYKTTAGETVVAVASTLVAQLRVLGLTSGDERWTSDLAGATRGSPLLVNGRVIVGTDAGVIHSFQSRTNVAPSAPAPLGPIAGQDVDASAVTLRWAAGLDPEGESLRYEVRLDDDGEILHDYDLAVSTTPAQLSLDVGQQLAPGRIYTFAVRARDSKGAWSSWSAPAQFRAVMAPSVELDGTPVAGLSAAIAMAHAGSTIKLGAGVYPLSSTLRLPAGVTMTGEAPHLTTLSGKGLATAVQVGAGNQLHQLTVTGAKVGVEVTAGDDARLQNVVLRDNEQLGLSVAAGAGAHLINATVARNGSGVSAAGKTDVRNSIVSANGVGITATDASLVQSRYNDVFGNRTADYQGAAAAATDRQVSVTFGTGDADLRLAKAQATTDQGDPTDDFSNEPEPNGARINQGAFGNTPFAELSDPTLEPPPPPPAPSTESGAKPKSSGGLCTLGGNGGAPDGAVALVLLALVWGRRCRRRDR
jgi:outer membrane protein assembly factor BamB